MAEKKGPSLPAFDTFSYAGITAALQREPKDFILADVFLPPYPLLNQTFAISQGLNSALFDHVKIGLPPSIRPIDIINGMGSWAPPAPLAEAKGVMDRYFNDLPEQMIRQLHQDGFATLEQYVKRLKSENYTTLRMENVKAELNPMNRLELEVADSLFKEWSTSSGEWAISPEERFAFFLIARTFGFTLHKIQTQKGLVDRHMLHLITNTTSALERGLSSSMPPKSQAQLQSEWSNHGMKIEKVERFSQTGTGVARQPDPPARPSVEIGKK